MSRMSVPQEVAMEARQFAADFARVTARWVEEGWHTAAEVEAWRAVIREDMQTAKGANPAIDPRPQVERIRAWCRTFRKIAAGMDSTKRGAA